MKTYFTGVNLRGSEALKMTMFGLAPKMGRDVKKDGM